MDPREGRPARRRVISVIAAVGSIAIGVTGLGSAALPAAAAAAPAAPAAPSSAAPAVDEHVVTLITGDRVHVTDLADGKHVVVVDPAQPDGGVKTLQVGKELHVVPDAAQPYLASGALDPDLFNVTKLIEYGYDDAHVTSTPVILELSGHGARSAPVPGLAMGRSLPSVGAAAAAASHKDAEKTWKSLTGKGRSASAPSATTLSAGSAPSLDAGIASIQLDGKVKASLDSSVPWIGAPAAWAAGLTGTGVTVAVLDTGYDGTHPDLAGQMAPGSTSFVPGQAVDVDPVGHGTHVTSTIVGTGAASDGRYRGVAPGAKVVMGKVLGDGGFGQDSWIIAGMEWAAGHAKIVSMSLGSQEPSGGDDLMAKAVDDLSASTGALFIVAAGNASAPETIGSPGAAASALTVGSVDDPSGALSWFSSQGPLAFSGNMKPDIAGPGNNITAARSAQSPGGGSYVAMSGTSMATPHVAGAAAIVLQQHPDYTAAQLRAALTSTARDTGPTSYQVGAGAVDVAAATTAQVIASGSGDFGMLKWGGTAKTLTRTIEYANRGDTAVTLSLDASLLDTTPVPDEGPGPLSVSGIPGVIALSTDSLTIPAGESRSVTVSADQAAVPKGHQYSGALVASAGGTPVARTALGIIAEAERYNLKITATGFDGAPIEAYAFIWDAKNQAVMTVAVEGDTTVRLPAGRYTVLSYLDLNRTSDSQVMVLLGDPNVKLQGKDLTVALDARTAKPVSVDVGTKGLDAVVQRMDLTVDDFVASAMLLTTEDGFYAQPMKADADQKLDFTSRWRLQKPYLSLSAGKLGLDVIPQIGSTFVAGDIRLTAVDAGTGSAADLAEVDVRGKAAVVTRSDAVSPHERVVNAFAAGAKLVIVANDADGELSEWVAGDDGTPVGGWVAGISGVQGRELLAQIHAGTTTVTGAGLDNADEIWDIARYSAGSIPSDLAYAPKKLARIDTTYAGQKGTVVGEFRSDFSPNTTYGAGVPLSTTRGITRTEWVSTENMRWIQIAQDMVSTWQIRDVIRSYDAGSRTRNSYFDAIVRPYVGPGYWAPLKDGLGLQFNLPNWADGANPERTGSVDTYAGNPHFSQSATLYMDGIETAQSEHAGFSVWDMPSGTHQFRLVDTATQDGLLSPGSTATRTEWTFSTTAPTANYDRIMLPMLQAYYDVARNPRGVIGADRTKGTPVALDLQLSHIKGAEGTAAVTDATLEARTAGGEWKAVPLTLRSRDTSDPGAPTPNTFSGGRAFVTVYGASVPVPDAGGWIDLRMTGKDAAGNSISQEITRAFLAAPARGVE